MAPADFVAGPRMTSVVGSVGRRGRPTQQTSHLRSPLAVRLVVFGAGLRQHLSHERKEVVRIHKQRETLEVTGC